MLGDLFALDDLFIIGLGFDIAGAYLLAKGLLATPGEIARQRAFSYHDVNAADAVAAARDRVDGSIGMRALLLGFVLQAVGYTIGLARASGDRDGPALSALVGIGLCALAIITVLGYWKLKRPDAVKSLLIHIARYDAVGGEMNLPSAKMLVPFGRELGYGLVSGEETLVGQARYCERVFGVAAVRDALEHTTVDLA